GERLLGASGEGEMIGITQAAQALWSWRLENCILYVTLEPCPMCAGAIVQARLPLVVFGCTDPKAGACQTLYTIASDPRLNHRALVVGGVLADRCAGPLSRFFRDRRAEGKKCWDRYARRRRQGPPPPRRAPPPPPPPPPP